MLSHSLLPAIYAPKPMALGLNYSQLHEFPELKHQSELTIAKVPLLLCFSPLKGTECISCNCALSVSFLITLPKIKHLLYSTTIFTSKYNLPAPTVGCTCSVGKTRSFNPLWNFTHKTSLLHLHLASGLGTTSVTKPNRFKAAFHIKITLLCEIH